MAPRDISSTEPYQRDNPLHFLMCALLPRPRGLGSRALVLLPVSHSTSRVSLPPARCKELYGDDQARLQEDARPHSMHAAWW